jgi:hypothetical protein
MPELDPDLRLDTRAVRAAAHRIAEQLERHGPATKRQLCEALGLRGPTCTRALRRLLRDEAITKHSGHRYDLTEGRPIDPLALGPTELLRLAFVCQLVNALQLVDEAHLLAVLLEHAHDEAVRRDGRTPLPVGRRLLRLDGWSRCDVPEQLTPLVEAICRRTWVSVRLGDARQQLRPDQIVVRDDGWYVQGKLRDATPAQLRLQPGMSLHEA